MTANQRNRRSLLVFGLVALAAALVLALCSERADAKPSKRTQPDFMLWRWIDCTPGAENVATDIINLDTVGHRYQIKTWVWEEGTLDRVVTRWPWVNPASIVPGQGYQGKITSDPLDIDDTTVRTKVTRGHYENVGGWQTWVNDQQLIDVTTEGCDRLHPIPPRERTIKISSGPR